MKRPIVAALAAISLLPARSLADPATVTPTPSLAPLPLYATVENELSPHYYGEAGSSDVVNLRGQIPYDASAYVIRVKLPIVAAAPPESSTGAGDLVLSDFAVLNPARGQWLTGATLRVPTANDSLGNHKYSLGPAFGYTTGAAALTYGFAQESYFSVIGPSWYPAVGKSKLAPVLRLALPNGWGVGLSTMQFTYDWVLNRWTDVPLGVRVEKRGIAGLASLEAYLDAERNLVHSPDTPGWTIRTALRWVVSR